MTGTPARRGAILLAAAALLATCSAPLPPTPTIPTTPGSRAYAWTDMVVGFIGSGTNDAWHVSNVASFDKYASDNAITLRPFDAAGKFANQIAQFHLFGADPSVNVIVLDPTQAGGYDAALKEAAASGKVVVVEGRRIDADPTLYATYVGSDLTAEGSKAASTLCDLLADSSEKNVAEIFETAEPSFEAARSAGFRASMSDCGITAPTDLQAALSPSAAGSASQAESESAAAVAAWLGRRRDIQGIFAHGDSEALGAIRAIKAAGLRPGKDILIVSIGTTFEATCDGLAYLVSGEVSAEIEYNPLLGPQVYAAALNALNGTPQPKWIPAQEGLTLAAQGPDALAGCAGCPGYQMPSICHSTY